MRKSRSGPGGRDLRPGNAPSRYTSSLRNTLAGDDTGIGLSPPSVGAIWILLCLELIIVVDLYVKKSVNSIRIESSRLRSSSQKRPIMASFPYFAEAEAKYSEVAQLVPI